MEAPKIDRLEVSAYTIPTDRPESDGTLAWDKTTMVLVELRAGNQLGIGYTYAARAAAELIHGALREVIVGRPLELGARFSEMKVRLRNLGQVGLGAMALSAVDVALWDLHARLLGAPLYTVLGAARRRVPIYGSGGFTSYTLGELSEQLGGWARAGIPRVKMKVGRAPAEDPTRVRAARRAIGDDTELFVDGNGAYGRSQSLAMAARFAEERVVWFEEPVSSDDLSGLHAVRLRAPFGMEIAAGEYGWDAFYFRRMLEAGAVDVLQADATRSGGITGFLQAAAIADAYGVPLSAHCAPALHLHPCAAVLRFRHLEYFHDHARIEQLFFDGAPRPEGGELIPDEGRPGLGLELKRRDAERYRS
jgi:L-alanine-DL-glutamate epimerase-like enolase superfamily enzyme